MRFSEAIWLGAMVHPQARNIFFDHNGNNEITATCAVGAAIIAVTDSADHLPDRLDERITSVLAANWPWILRQGTVCPACLGKTSTRVTSLAGNYQAEVLSIVIHLNDEHRKTRAEIASWITTIEPHEENVPTRHRPRPARGRTGNEAGSALPAEPLEKAVGTFFEIPNGCLNP
jgi:hypothetical protein